MITTLLTAGAFAVVALNSATPAQVSNNATSTKVVTFSYPKTWRGSTAGAFDCFWSGSNDSLLVSCGKVRLAIR